MCLQCHEHQGLAARIFAGEGFHASAVVRGKLCQVCHLEHRGAAFDPRGWKSIKGGEAGFDHDQTGWRLDGAHRDRLCTDCHSAKNVQGLPVYAGTDRRCGTCHRSHPHGDIRTALLACDRCHSERAWQPLLAGLAFNHDDRRDARVPLFAAHKTVACRTCHADARFVPTPDPDACERCHQSPHAGQVFSKATCRWCHTPLDSSFAKVRFDHTEKTRFDLGGHRTLACTTCHAKALGMKSPPATCESCHASANPHGSRFAAFPHCGTCHAFSAQQTKWQRVFFDHKQTKFPLTGKHDTKCAACHTGPGFQRLSTGCIDCHTHERVHDKKYRNHQCTMCHRPTD